MDTSGAPALAILTGQAQRILKNLESYDKHLAKRLVAYASIPVAVAPALAAATGKTSPAKWAAISAIIVAMVAVTDAAFQDLTPDKWLALARGGESVDEIVHERSKKQKCQASLKSMRERVQQQLNAPRQKRVVMFIISRQFVVPDADSVARTGQNALSMFNDAMVQQSGRGVTQTLCYAALHQWFSACRSNDAKQIAAIIVHLPPRSLARLGSGALRGLSDCDDSTRVYVEDNTIPSGNDKLARLWKKCLALEHVQPFVN